MIPSAQWVLATALAAAACFGAGYAIPRADPGVDAPPPPPAPVSQEADTRPEAPADTPRDPSDLVAIWEEAAPDGREAALFRELAAWIDADGPAVYETLRSGGTSSPAEFGRWLRSRGLPFVAVQIGRSNRAAALDILRDAPSSDLRRALAPLVLGEPPATVLKLVAGGRFDGEPAHWFGAGAKLADAGPEGRTTVLEKIEGTHISELIPDDNETLRLATGYVSRLAERSFDDALAFARSLPPPVEDRAEAAAVAALFETDPERAKDEAVRLGQFAAAAEKMAESDLGTALDWLESATAEAGPETRHDAFRTLTPFFRDRPISDVLAATDRFLGDAERPSTPPTPGMGAAPHTPVTAAALAYLMAQGIDAAPGFVEVLGSKPASPARDGFLAAALHLWALRDPAEAGARAIELLGAGEPAALAGGLAVSLAHEPELAIALAREGAGKSGGFFRNFGVAAANEDPDRVAQALASAAEPPPPGLVREFTDAWASHDFYSASAWLANLPPGAARDSGAAGLVPRLAPVDPDAAGEWLATIGDPAARAEAARLAYLLWRDRESAAAWIEAAPIGAADKAAILNPPATNR